MARPELFDLADEVPGHRDDSVNDDDEKGFGSNLEVELNLMTFNVATGQVCKPKLLNRLFKTI